MPASLPPATSAEEEDAASQGVHSVIDDILDQYRFNWEPEYRLKFKKELKEFTFGVGISKPHEAPTRLRLTVKPPQCDEGLGAGRFVQKVLVMPQQRFAALYSRKLALGFLRLQFVAGYFWDSRRPSLDYRLSTQWNEGLRFKRKEYYQPTDNLLIRARWHMDMQLPDVEGHLGGREGSTQVPVEVEYGSLDFSVTQLDFVCDLDGFRSSRKIDQPEAAGALAAAAQPLDGAGCSSGHGGKAPTVLGRISWPWERRAEAARGMASDAGAGPGRRCGCGHSTG